MARRPLPVAMAVANPVRKNWHWRVIKASTWPNWPCVSHENRRQEANPPAACFPASARSAKATEQKGRHKQDQKDDEQDLGDTRCSSSNPAKAEHTGDDGNDQEGNGPAQHKHFLFVS